MEKETFEGKFWEEKVDVKGPNDCWRHFTISREGKRVYRRAQREAWLRARGPIPEGLCVLHKCDNPPCVNPAHLFLGTHRDNSLDYHKKRDREVSRENGDEIRCRAASGEDLGKLAVEFGITWKSVWWIKKGRHSRLIARVQKFEERSQNVSIETRQEILYRIRTGGESFGDVARDLDIAISIVSDISCLETLKLMLEHEKLMDKRNTEEQKLKQNRKTREKSAPKLDTSSSKAWAESWLDQVEDIFVRFEDEDYNIIRSLMEDVWGGLPQKEDERVRVVDIFRQDPRWAKFQIMHGEQIGLGRDTYLKWSDSKQEFVPSHKTWPLLYLWSY